eukprot:GFKZ01001122.1.p2 GENE.GFKZ01001122.1~~GFKZ01001122.1.p2  ORF type:complete len:103 (-),score=10.08 GFKZ01001122.1:378-686(-)
MNGSLSEGRQTEFQAEKASIASEYVFRVHMVVVNTPVQSFFDRALEARNAAAAVSTAEMRPIPIVGCPSSIGWKGIYNSLNMSLSRRQEDMVRIEHSMWLSR